MLNLLRQQWPVFSSDFIPLLHLCWICWGSSGLSAHTLGKRDCFFRFYSSPRPSRFSNTVKSSNGLLTKAWLLQPHTTLHVKVITWRFAVDKHALHLNLLLVSSGDWAGCFISPGNDLVFSFHQLITIDIQHVIQDISTSHANPIKACLQRSAQHVVRVLFRRTTICKIAWLGAAEWNTTRNVEEFLENEKYRWFVSSTCSHPQ